MPFATFLFLAKKVVFFVLLKIISLSWWWLLQPESLWRVQCFANPLLYAGRERQMKTSAPPHLSANNMKCESFDLDSTIATSSSMLRINWHRICNTIIKLERIIRKLEASCIWFSLTATVKMSHKGKMGWTHIFILSIKHVMLAVGHDHCWTVCWLSYFLYLFYFPCASEWWHFWD